VLRLLRGLRRRNDGLDHDTSDGARDGLSLLLADDAPCLAGGLPLGIGRRLLLRRERRARLLRLLTEVGWCGSYPPIARDGIS